MSANYLSGLDDEGILVRCPACGQRNSLRYAKLAGPSQCGKCQTRLGPVAQPIPVQASRQFRALINGSTLPVLVDFWADWCGPCKMVAPELEKVAHQSAGQFLVAKVNTDQLQDLAAAFGISSIPTLCLLKGGREIARQSGAAPAPAILDFVRKNTAA